MARTRAFALGVLGFSAVAVAWTSFSGTAYADAAPAARPAASPAVAPAHPTADPIAGLTGHLGHILGTTAETVHGVLTTVTTAPTGATPPSVGSSAPATATGAHSSPAPGRPAPLTAPAVAPSAHVPGVHLPSGHLPSVHVSPTREKDPAQADAPTSADGPSANHLPGEHPLLGHTTQDVTAALTGALTSTVDATATPATDLLRSLLEVTPIPAIIDSTPIVSSTVHSLAATTAKAVDTVTGAVDHGVSPTLGLLGVGVAPLHDTAQDVVTPLLAPLSGQDSEPTTPVRPIATLPLGPPATAPPVIPGVVTLPTAPPKSSAMHLRTPRNAQPVRSRATSRLDTTPATTTSSVEHPSVARPIVAGLLGASDTGRPGQPTSNLPAPVSAGSQGDAAPVIDTSSPEVTRRPLVEPGPRDHGWRLPVAPSSEPGSRPD